MSMVSLNLKSEAHSNVIHSIDYSQFKLYAASASG